MNCLVSPLTSEGLSVGDLGQIYRTHGNRPEFRQWALAAVDILDPGDVWRALWLIRRSLKDDPALAPADARRLIERADGFLHWIARLTFCQMMAEAALPVSLRSEAFPVLASIAEDRRAIVRAWAISALHPLRASRGHGARVRRLLDRSRKDPSKAMKARLRRLGPS